MKTEMNLVDIVKKHQKAGRLGLIGAYGEIKVNGPRRRTVVHLHLSGRWSIEQTKPQTTILESREPGDNLHALDVWLTENAIATTA